MKKLGVKRQMKYLLLTGLLFVIAVPAFSQITYTMTDKHGRLVRQSIRDANQVDATTYRDTHLNMEGYTFKKGETGRTKRQGKSRLFKAEQETPQYSAADRDKKRFRLFRKKEK